MAADAQNLQYSDQSKFFSGNGAAYGSTGAPGSAGAQDLPPGQGGGAVIASPVVSMPYASSQIPANMPTIPVTQGDTSGMSSDNPVSPSPGVEGFAGYLSTGAGTGSGEHIPHPNSQARPS